MSLTCYQYGAQIIIFMIVLINLIRINENKNYLGFIKFLIIFCLFSQISYSQNIKFEAENIETSENNYITATTNVVIKDDLGTKIYGDKLIIDKDKNTYTITGNVKLEDEKNSLIINSNKIIFSEIENTIKTFDQTKINKKINIFWKLKMFYSIEIKKELFQMMKL